MMVIAVTITPPTKPTPTAAAVVVFYLPLLLSNKQNKQIIMDCTISDTSTVRTFCASIGCLSKIGKDLYLDYDPMDGLLLTTLNDAKSAWCVFDYQPKFFTRCTTPSVATNSSGNNNRKRTNQSISSNNTQDTSSQQGEEENEEETRFCIRVPMRALIPIVRPRKGVMALRIRSEGHNNNGGSNTNANLQLAFEFHIDASAAASEAGGNGNRNNNYYSKPRGNTSGNNWIKIIHRIGVAEADNVVAVASKRNTSEMIASPRVLMKLLEPLKKTAEIAFIMTKDATNVVATSFHHPIDAIGNRNNNNNTQSSSSLVAASHALLKTETSIAIDDLDEYDFVTHRNLTTSQPSQQSSQESIDDSDIPQQIPPSNVNEEVTLVFSIKEAKALLQFCSQYPPSSCSENDSGWQNDNDENNNDYNNTSFYRNNNYNNNKVALSYHWGGKPLIWESKFSNDQYFKVQLILATLDYHLLQQQGQTTGTTITGGGGGGRGTTTNAADVQQQQQQTQQTQE